MATRPRRRGIVYPESVCSNATSEFRKSPEEYGWEYRRVSGTCSILQFAAAMTPYGCRLFQFVAIPC